MAKGQTVLVEHDSVPFTVKNTFIDIDANSVEFIDLETDKDHEGFTGFGGKRQVSEPAIFRTMSQHQQPPSSPTPEPVRKASVDDLDIEAWKRIVTEDVWTQQEQQANSMVFCPVAAVPMPTTLIGAITGDCGMDPGMNPQDGMEFQPQVALSGKDEVEQLANQGYMGTYMPMQMSQQCGEFMLGGGPWMFGTAGNFPTEEEHVKTTARSNSEEAAVKDEVQRSVAALAATVAPPAGDKAKVAKPRRRRGAGSLIDLAKQRAALAQTGSGAAGSTALDANAVSQRAVRERAPGAAGGGAGNFCPYCGGRTQVTFKFCSFCGASLSFA